MDHGLRLELVGRDDADEIAEAVLIRQVATGGAVADLRNVEQLEQILHLDADGARAWSDDTHQDFIAFAAPAAAVVVVALGAGGQTLRWR